LGSKPVATKPQPRWARRAPGPGEILSNVVHSQTDAHAPYGGVVPEIASRAHLEILDHIYRARPEDAGIALAELDGIAAPPARADRG